MTLQGPITEPYLLAVEGKDDENFFRRLMDKRGISGIDIRRYREDPSGKLHTELDVLLKQRGFGENVRGYAVVRDANSDANAAMASIQDALRKLDEPCPNQPGEFASDARRKVGVLLIPPGRPNGCLEDLCLDIAAKHDVMECAEAFMECLRERCPRKPSGAPRDVAKAFFPRHASKAKAQAFMAGLYDSPHEIGRAAQWDYWDWESPELKGIIQFLNELAS